MEFVVMPTEGYTAGPCVPYGCDHIAHVNTQIYYAVFVGIIAIVIGYLPAGFGVPSWVSLIAGVIVVFLGLRFIGEEVPFEEEAV